VAVSNLAAVPTLALNAPESDSPLPYTMYLFGMQVENEARQLARLAARHGRRRALIVASDSPLSKRLAEAFRAEWGQRGNQIEDEFQYTTDLASLSKLRDALTVGKADMVFLALDGKHAKLIRSYLGLSMPIYATSLVHTSDAPLANYELNGVYFVDMPWLLAPDHPAVLSYERPDPAQANIEYQRFYAIGIDAYRIAQSLLRPDAEFQPLDGVTGYITLDRERRLAREAVPAQFVQGETKVLSDASSQ
jgi:outer membrane PBP1 activator LpoA protein